MDGREYHFVSDEAFDAMVARGELLEWASFAGHRYGTPREPVARRIAAGVPALLEIDIDGARQVRRAVPDALLVFLAPPSWDELVRRLSGRGTEPPEVIARRLELAAERARGRPGVRHHARQHVCQGRVRAAGSLDDGLIGPEQHR